MAPTSETKPLFIPLSRQFWALFASGQKDIEYRRYGPKWNEKVCTIGRQVTLSNGYTQRRISGTIRSFIVRRLYQFNPSEQLELKEVWPALPRDAKIACIGIDVVTESDAHITDRGIEMATGYYSLTPPITSLRLEQGHHDRLTVWDSGGNAGTLTLCSGHGKLVASLFRGQLALMAYAGPNNTRRIDELLIPRVPDDECLVSEHGDVITAGEARKGEAR